MTPMWAGPTRVSTARGRTGRLQLFRATRDFCDSTARAATSFRLLPSVREGRLRFSMGGGISRPASSGACVVKHPKGVLPSTIWSCSRHRISVTLAMSAKRGVSMFSTQKSGIRQNRSCTRRSCQCARVANPTRPPWVDCTRRTEHPTADGCEDLR